MSIINKNDELTLTHVNETKGADLSIAALHKEMNKFKAPQTFRSSPNRRESKEFNKPLVNSNSERYVFVIRSYSKSTLLKTL